MKLVQACLATGNVCKRRFHNRRSLLKLVQGCLGTVNVCKHRYHNRGSGAGLIKYRESL